MSDGWPEIFGRIRGIGEQFVVLLPGMIAAIVVFACFYLLGKAVRSLVRRWTARNRKHANIGIVLGRVSAGATFVLGILVAAVVAFPTFTPGRLVEVLGLGSIAAGFAFRDILQNYLAGILLLVTEPFRMGDQVVFKEFEGTVEEIQTRATTIRTYDGRRVVVPNAELFTNAITVNTAFENRRVEYDVGIGYGDDLEEARRLIFEVLRGIDSVLEDPPPDVLAYELAPSAVVLRVRWWITPPRRRDHLDSRDRVVAGIKAAFAERGIDLPFPTQHVLFHDQIEETDGDRRRQREGWPAGAGSVPKPRTPSPLRPENGPPPARS